MWLERKYNSFSFCCMFLRQAKGMHFAQETILQLCKCGCSYFHMKDLYYFISPPPFFLLLRVHSFMITVFPMQLKLPYFNMFTVKLRIWRKGTVKLNRFHHVKSVLNHHALVCIIPPWTNDCFSCDVNGGLVLNNTEEVFFGKDCCENKSVVIVIMMNQKKTGRQSEENRLY